MKQKKIKKIIIKMHYTHYVKSVETEWRGHCNCPHPHPRSPATWSNLNPFYSLIDGLQQSPVLGILIAIFVGKHVGQCVHVTVEVVFRQRFLL